MDKELMMAFNMNETPLFKISIRGSQKEVYKKLTWQAFFLKKK